MRRLALILSLAPLPGCLAAQLKAPATDHAAQLSVIAERCDDGAYCEHVAEAAKQARCIVDIIDGEECDDARP